MASFKDLIAWQKAIQLSVAIYHATAKFPRHEIYGLASQLRRAAVSIASNIAEGQARGSDREFHHFLANARGSLAEVETQLLIARELQYLSSEEVLALLARLSELGKITSGLRDRLRLRGGF